MFFVESFNPGDEEFETIGAFSKRDEAEEFAKANTTNRAAPIVHETTFKTVVDRATNARLGAMAKVFEHLTKFSTMVERSSEQEVVVKFTADTSGLVVGIESARAALGVSKG